MMVFWGWGTSREWINWISFISKGACHCKTHPRPGMDIDLWHGYCFVGVTENVCVSVFVCSGKEHDLCRIVCFSYSFVHIYKHIFCNFAQCLCTECVWILYRKMSCVATLCSSAVTVMHCVLRRGHWGWVSTQSELYIKPIGLIYSPNNSRLIKKRKGRGGI